jgi:hypothetical protein
LYQALSIKKRHHHMLRRRQLIKTLAAGTAGIWVSSHFISCNTEPAVRLGQISYTKAEIENIYALSKSILPSVDREKFLWLTNYISDCFSPEKQQQFREGYIQFNQQFLKGNSNNFSGLPVAKQKDILQTLEKDNQSNAALSFFYKSLKAVSIRSYTGSKIFLTQVQLYVHIPGKYQGCVGV